MKTPIVLFAIIAVLLVAVFAAFALRGSDTPEATATPFITSVGAFDSPSYITSHEPPNDPYSVAVEVTEGPSATPRPSSTPRPKPTPSESSTIRPSPTPEQVYIDIELPEVPEGVAFEDATGFNVYSVPLSGYEAGWEISVSWYDMIGLKYFDNDDWYPTTQIFDMYLTSWVFEYNYPSEIYAYYTWLKSGTRWYTIDKAAGEILAFALTDDPEPDLRMDDISVILVNGWFYEFKINGVNDYSYIPILEQMKLLTHVDGELQMCPVVIDEFGFEYGDESSVTAATANTSRDFAVRIEDEPVKQQVIGYCAERLPAPSDDADVRLFILENGDIIGTYHDEVFSHNESNDYYESYYYDCSWAMLLIHDGVITELELIHEPEYDALDSWRYENVLFRLGGELYVRKVFWEWYAIHTYTIP